MLSSNHEALFRLARGVCRPPGTGGMVVCRAAELMRDRVGRLALVDAVALFDGERIRAIARRSTSVRGKLTNAPTRADAAKTGCSSSSIPGITRR